MKVRPAEKLQTTPQRVNRQPPTVSRQPPTKGQPSTGIGNPSTGHPSTTTHYPFGLLAHRERPLHTPQIMKIGIIGSGHIGGTLAKLFVGAGHDVMLSNSRGPESLRDEVAALGPHARAGEVAEAARFGDVVVLAVPWRSPEALPPADTVPGRIVIDAMNPYTAEGGQVDLGASSSSEETAKRLPGARLVKAFNTIWFKHLDENGDPSKPVDERHAIPVASDDAAAKQTVMQLIEEIGFGPVDNGSLRNGKTQQPGEAIYNAPMPARAMRSRIAGAK